MIAQPTGQLHCGTFDAEQFWRDPELAKLPGLADPENLRIVSMMDELLFAFCRPEDTLITRKALNPAHRQYLSEIGFRFRSNGGDLDGQLEQRHKSMLQLLAEAERGVLDDILSQGAELDAFAAIPFIREASERHGLVCRIPDMDVIRQVNTKTYSTLMKERVNLPNISLIVGSAADIQETGSRLLENGPFLIKDNYGVSGKGNLLIDAPGILERVVSYTEMQEKKGKATEFVIEPYLQKACDFSCQFYIDPAGEVTILSLQKLANDEFAYQESYTPEPEFIELLERKGYFELMKAIGRELYRDGYFGHVCIDSMQLTDGELVPMIEINARKSMSLIKHQIDRYLQPQQLIGNLRYYSLSCVNEGLRFEDVLSEMEQAELLFRPGQASGIIPLTANTLTINRRSDKPYKGRIYVSVIGRDAAERTELAARLGRIFNKLFLQVMN